MADAEAMDRRVKQLQRSSWSDIPSPYAGMSEAERHAAIRAETQAADQQRIANTPVHDPYAQEVGPGAAIQRRIENAAYEYVAEPMAEAGYPSAGAAMAAVPATLTDLVIPQTGADFAGALIPFGKVAKGVAKLEGKAAKVDPAALARSKSNAEVMARAEAEEAGRKLDAEIVARQNPPRTELTAAEKLAQRGEQKKSLDRIPVGARAWQDKLKGLTKDMTKNALSAEDVKKLSDDDLADYARASTSLPWDTVKHGEAAIEIGKLNKQTLKDEAKSRGVKNWVEFAFGSGRVEK